MTDPRSLKCWQCGAEPNKPCVKGGFADYPNDGPTRSHKARHVDAYRKDLIDEAKNAPEGSVLNDAYREVKSRQESGTLRVSAFLEAVKWLQERQEPTDANRR